MAARRKHDGDNDPAIGYWIKVDLPARVRLFERERHAPDGEPLAGVAISAWWPPRPQAVW
jgi:hypothetical protein